MNVNQQQLYLIDISQFLFELSAKKNIFHIVYLSRFILSSQENHEEQRYFQSRLLKAEIHQMMSCRWRVLWLNAISIQSSFLPTFHSNYLANLLVPKFHFTDNISQNLFFLVQNILIVFQECVLLCVSRCALEAKIVCICHHALNEQDLVGKLARKFHARNALIFLDDAFSDDDVDLF